MSEETGEGTAGAEDTWSQGGGANGTGVAAAAGGALAAGVDPGMEQEALQAARESAERLALARRECLGAPQWAEVFLQAGSPAWR